MATFNSVPALPAGAAGDAMGMNAGSAPPMPMDQFEQDLAFGEALLNGAAMQPFPFTPTYDFDGFATTFDDPFAYSSRSLEPTHNHDALQEESSPQELDNKLLGFSDPIRSFNVVDDNDNIAEPHMSAELYGMFFIAEDVFGGENTGRPLELTCYRRNLWQCSGLIILPRAVVRLADDQGRQLPIFELSASITAIESIEGKATEIVSIPWKSSAPQAGDENKAATAPPHLSLDLSSAQEIDAARVSLPVSWKRLQFKHATANNGRRKGLQQHYVVQISLLGKIKSGEIIKIAEIHSGPVIVRGRSPRNFDSRKDVPLTGDKRLERKNTSGSDGISQRGDREREVSQAALPRYQPQTPSPHPAKRIAMPHSNMQPPVPTWPADPSALNNAAAAAAAAAVVASTGPPPPPQRSSSARQNAPLPINLSLSEDETSPNRSSAELRSPQMARAISTAAVTAGSSPADDPDPLCEYFPLTVDDWMPPVDAVYRPHVVHHTIVPPEIKAQQVQSKAKRYFAAD